MDRIKSGIRKNAIVVLLFWAVLIYLLAMFIIKGVVKSSFTGVQVAFIFAIGCFTYVDVSLSIEYYKLKKMVEDIQRIKNKYDYMQVYIIQNYIVVEIQNEDIEKLNNEINNLKYKMIELDKEEKVVQFAIKP